MPHSFCIDLTTEEKNQLLGIARTSIESGLQGTNTPTLDISHFSGNLARALASFVTLTQNDDLRGCMGSLEASVPLAQSVAINAYNAAFRDPRFAKLTEAESNQTNIDISVLSPMQSMLVKNRKDLLNQLKPDIDGLLLEDSGHRATFLPKVWEKLSADEFLRHLWTKAGLPVGYWSESIRFSRYHTVSFSE